MSFNTAFAALKFHYTSKQFNIGEWEVFYEGKKINGSGLTSVKEFCGTLPNEETTVIYCKNIKLLYILNKNVKAFDFSEESKIKAIGPKEFDFFTLRTTDNRIEFRNWNNFFNKIDDCEEFSINFAAAMDYFKCNNLEKFGVFTLSHDAFKRGVKWRYEDYVGYGIYSSMRKIVSDCVPKQIDTYEFYDNYWLGGMAFYNPFSKDAVLSNICSFDKKSCHLASMVFEKFPLTDFEEIDLQYWKEVQEDFDNTAFIAQFLFKDLSQKPESTMSQDVIGRFGHPDLDGNWLITINEVDWKWFKEEFEWREAYICGLKIAQKSFLPKNFIQSLLVLYEEKELYKKEDIRRTFAKQCTELPYGQSIKKTTYLYEGRLDEEGNVVIEASDEKTSLKEIRKVLEKRLMPMQLGVWTVAYSRLDIWKATKLAGAKETIYCDTDCIKTTRSREFQTTLNEEIEQKAKAAQKRFPSLVIPQNLGRWTFEYCADEFIVAGIKWYAYSVDNKIHFKAAGAQLDVLKEWFKDKELKDFNTKLEVEGLYKPQVKYDLKKNIAIIKTQNSYSSYLVLEQECYEMALN